MLPQFPLSGPLVKIYCEILNNRCKESFTIRRCCKDPRMSMGKYPGPRTLWNSQTAFCVLLGFSDSQLTVPLSFQLPTAFRKIY